MSYRRICRSPQPITQDSDGFDDQGLLMPARPPTQPSAASTPALVPQGAHVGKPAMPMGRPFTMIGSRHRAHLHLLSRSVSKAHAVVINDNGNLYVRDTASREHVYVN